MTAVATLIEYRLGTGKSLAAGGTRVDGGPGVRNRQAASGDRGL
jgi:hypothetical protein